MAATPGELVRKLSDVMHELNINGLDGDAILDAVDEFVSALSALLPSSGGGGAAINDEATSATTTWSSELITAKLDERAPGQVDLLDPVTGQPNGNTMGTGALVSMLYYMLTINQQKALRLYNTTGIGPTELLPNIIITDTLPPTGGANPNSVYLILAPDGTCTVHIPNLTDNP